MDRPNYSDPPSMKVYEKLKGLPTAVVGVPEMVVIPLGSELVLSPGGKVPVKTYPV